MTSFNWNDWQTLDCVLVSWSTHFLFLFLLALLGELFDDVAEEVVAGGSEVTIEVAGELSVFDGISSWSFWLLLLLLLSLACDLLTKQVSEEISLLIPLWLLRLLISAKHRVDDVHIILPIPSKRLICLPFALQPLRPLLLPLCCSLGSFSLFLPFSFFVRGLAGSNLLFHTIHFLDMPRL